MFEENGFEDESKSWPPPDPDRMVKTYGPPINQDSFVQDRQTERERINAFRSRQQQDFLRQRPFHHRLQKRFDKKAIECDDDLSEAGSASGEEGWRNSEGERLRDFGVDEDVEFYDEDDVPLSELLRRKRML